MRIPTSAELIEVWERGATQHWVDHALVLLSMAHPEKTIEQLQELTIAERDHLLLELHRNLFGPSLDCFAECPQCEERLEFSVSAQNFLEGGPQSSKSIPYEFASSDFLVRFRAPNSGDLGALRTCSDVAAASRILLKRCVLEARHGDEPISATELPADVVAMISSMLEKSERDADTLVMLECQSCAHGWEQSFDIVTFLWTKFSARAKRFLGEVHTLAWAYGWSEADILAMSPVRRQFYLDRVDNG
jgi:hypothetical protein